MAWNLLVKCDDPQDRAVGESANVLLAANLGIEDWRNTAMPVPSRSPIRSPTPRLRGMFG